jgi:hypothetical protein
MHIPMYLVVDHRTGQLQRRVEGRAELEAHLATQSAALHTLDVYEARLLPTRAEVRVVVDYD